MSSFFDLQPGRVIGRNYQIIEFLGSGWEGEVYKIEERSTGIPRAVKIFYDRAHISRHSLRRYARKLFKLRECGIITQYHHRESARVCGRQVELFISDFVEGEMLSAFLVKQKQKRLASFEALHLLFALASGIEQIHLLGEYHGDIHSDNIIVSRRGLGFEVHLLDFFDLGRATRERILWDVYDLVSLLYEMIGGAKGYRTAGDEIRKIVSGQKRTLIRRKFRTASQLRVALENLRW